tara:strand:+ start:236 stop:490 length:255 start_codon:yes stop_codon:yes gene_type:complete
MTQSERVSELFRRIRDWHVDKVGMDIRDAASDLQEFMRQYCREYNNETYEWEDISDTKKIALLRHKFIEDKKWLKEYKLNKIVN